jgi:hypothetical protein
VHWIADWPRFVVYRRSVSGRGDIIMGDNHEIEGIEPFTPLQAAQLLLDEWKFR